jgi:CoA:oxalate CoA-transferase
VNERAGAMLSGIDTDGEPIALSANESHIFEMADGTRLTIASSPIYSPMFMRYCAMMRRSDLLTDPRYATAKLRRQNLASLLAEVRAWLATFDSLEQLQAQVSEAGLAVGRVRTIGEFAESDWVKEWNAVVDVDDRGGGRLRMPGNPWIFSRSELPSPGVPAYQGEHNREILHGMQLSESQVLEMEKRNVLLTRR